MFKQALNLRLAVHVFATENDFAINVRKGFSADGAFVRCGHGLGAGRAQFFFDVGNFRDDLATLLYADGVAEVKVETSYFVEVVEGGALHCRSRESHRCEVRDWRYRTRAPHLKFYGQ